MTTKLTLTMKKSTIEKAKSYAKHTGRSLSELVEKYLETITLEEKPIISSKLKSIIGTVKLPDNFDEETDRYGYFENKHL